MFVVLVRVGISERAMMGELSVHFWVLVCFGKRAVWRWYGSGDITTIWFSGGIEMYE